MPQNIIGKIRGEIYLFWQFIRNDIWATIVPGLMTTCAALSHTQHTLLDSGVILFESFLYFVLYAYSFTMTNQLMSEEEDRINKPFRPLPSGLISKNKTLLRIVLFTVLFLLYGLGLGVGGWALLWVLTHLFHNFIGHKHWFTKNIVSMSLGIFSMVGAGWEIVSRLDSSELKWAITVSLIFGTCAVIQDFRDVPGDRLINRRTLPIDIGDYKARIVSFVLCFISFILLSLLVIIPANRTLLGDIFTASIFTLYAIVAIRVISYKTVESDRKTYTILLYLFCLVLLSGIVYL